MVNNMVRTTTRIITKDTTFFVFLLFILNIFLTLLSFKINKAIPILLKGYYEIPLLGKFSGLYYHRGNF